MGSNGRAQPRKFEYTPAIRKAVPLIIGLNSPSGGGKTYSALRLATGIQRVVGGEIAGIDTEANRMLHYAPQPGEKPDPSKGKFDFRHIPFTPPFSPSDYLDILEFVVSKGARTIIIDSASHLHDGPGGVLEMHAVELDRMGGGEKNNFRAWAKPKADLRNFINAMTTGIGESPAPLNLIFCFRAKNKLKVGGGEKEAVKLGYMPIASEEFIFELTTNILLYPGSRGVPTWKSSMPGEDSIIKLPDQFQNMFGARAALDEEMGQKMAQWAVGGDAPKRQVDPETAKKNADWLAYWARKGITTERVLASLGKSSIEHIDVQDRATLDSFAKQLKAKEKTAEQLFSSNEPPSDDDDDVSDEEKANRDAAAPTPEEIAAIEAKKNGSATTGKGA